MSFSDYFNQVQDLYIAYYQRPADPAGLIYWSQMANQAGGLTPQIVNAFATSQEAQDNYGTITPANIGTVINDIYEALFNRSADPSGLQFYENGFDNGTFTAGTIALNILNGAQGNDLLTLDNKLAAAMQFTQALDSASLDSGSASQLTTTYDSADIQSAKSYLSGVSSNPATLYTAAQTTGYIVEHIASTTDPIYINNVSYYDFTTGIDHLVGTSPIINVFEGSLGAYGYNQTIQPGDSASGYSSATNTLQIVGNDSGIFPLGSLGLTNIQNVSISGDNYGLNFTNTSGIQNLTSTAAGYYNYNSYGSDNHHHHHQVQYILNGQNVTINDTSGHTYMELSGTFGNVSLNNDNGVTYNINNTGTAQAATNLAINNIGSYTSFDSLYLTSISALNLNVSGTDSLLASGDNSLTTLNISVASEAFLLGALMAPSLTTLSIASASASTIGLVFFSALSALSTVNAAQDAGNLYLDFTNFGASTGTLASGFAFTGGTSPTTELVFTSSMLTGSFGTVTPGSGTNILGINDSGSSSSTTSIESSGALVNTINTAFAGFNTLDILTASGSCINASLLTHIDNYYVDNAGANTISNLTSSDAVSMVNIVNILNISWGNEISGVALSLSGTDQTLHVNIGGDSTFDSTTGLSVNNLSTSGDYNVILNSYGSGAGSNTISNWNYASANSTADHNITIGGNYDLTVSDSPDSSGGLFGGFGSASQTSALNITNVFNASSFDGASSSNSYHLNITDNTVGTAGSGAASDNTIVNNLFIAPTNTSMSLIDNASGVGGSSGATGLVNVYFDVHNAVYGNLTGGLVDSFALSGTNTHGYLLFDTNASGSGASTSGYGTITAATVTGTSVAQDLTQIDNLGHANTLYQFSIGSSNYIVDTGANTSTINDDIVVLIGTASAVGNSVTLASVNATQYHAVPADPIYSYYDFTTGIDHLVGTSPIINIFEGTLNSANQTIQPGDGASGYSGAVENTLQINGNDSGTFPLSSLGLTNIQNVSISGDNYGLDFTNTSGIQNLTSTAANGWGVIYTLNGQNVTINDTASFTYMELSGTFGNVSLNNDSGGVMYNLDNTGTAPTNLAIDNIGSDTSLDSLYLTGISALNLNVSGTDYLGYLSGDSSLTTLNISGARGALLYGGLGGLDVPSLTTLNIAGASDVSLVFPAVSALSTVNAVQDAGSLYLDFTSGGANTGTIASGFAFTGGTSPTTELVFTSSMLTGSFGTVTPGSGTNILGINDSGSSSSTTSIESSGALVNNINTAFSGFNTLDILTASGSCINASLLTHIDNYYVDNAFGNTISGLTSSDAVSILQSSINSSVALGLSGTDQTLHVNIGGDLILNPTTSIFVFNLYTSGDYNVILNSYGSGTSGNTITTWNYASANSTADHNITIGGNYDLTANLSGGFGTGSQTSAVNVTNVFNASSFDGISATGSSTYNLTITDYTSGIGNSGSTPAVNTTVNNLFIAPTNTTMSLTDHASGGTSSTVNIYFDVHNAAYGNLAGGLVDSFTLSGTNTHDYLLFDTNAVGLGTSSFGTIAAATVTGTTLAQDLAQIDNLGHANTLYQFSIGSSNYIVDTGANTSTINDDIVVLIGTASAVGNSVTLASVNATQYHAVAV